MKKNNWKWWLLGALVLMMVYIWYDAFETMAPQGSSYRVTAPATAAKSPTPDHSGVEYEAPKVNPFQQPTVTPPQATQPTRPRGSQTPEAPPRLDPRYRLTGILNRAQQSQAVITFQDSSGVKSIGDSIGGWQLLEIDEKSAVLGHDKNRDTLWLYGED